MINKSTEKFKLILSTAIFGTIGIFVKYIPLPSSVIAFVRGLSGAVFLVVYMIIKKEKISLSDIKKNMLPLILSGAFIGINWIFLFESYRYTSVSVSTVCYYTAPVFIVIFSAILLHEKLSIKKIICTVAALCGMIFVSGVLEEKAPTLLHIRGIIFGLCAAVMYSGLVLTTKKVKDISSNSMTVVQLSVAAIVIFPYALLTRGFTKVSLNTKEIILLIVVGIVHTGVAYALYLSSVKNLRTQTVAIFSYIDPITAIILSSVVLKERMSLYAVIGTVVILLSAFVSELPEKQIKKRPTD